MAIGAGATGENLYSGVPTLSTSCLFCGTSAHCSLIGGTRYSNLLLRLGLLQDGNVGIGVVRDREGIFVGPTGATQLAAVG